MPALNIPERYQAGVQKIATLPTDTLEALAAALNDVSAAVSSKDRTAAIRTKVEGISQDDLALIIRTLDSLYQVRAHLETPPEKFVSDIIEAVRGTKATALASSEDLKEFQSRLTRLLSAAPLAISAKAQVLEREYPQLYHSAKIVTDIRPIFGQSTKDPPDGVILDHTLKVVYHECLGDHRELYLAVNSSDLAELKKIIQRAEEKESTLRTLLSSKGIKVL